MNRYSVYSKYGKREYLPDNLTIQNTRPYVVGNYIPGTTKKTGWWYTYGKGSLIAAENYQDDKMVELLKHKFSTLIDVVRYNTDGTTTFVDFNNYDGFAVRAKTTKQDNCTLHGKYQEWHTNGRLFLEATFKKGVLHGITKVYHYNGNLHERCKFVRGRLHGNYLVCYDNGENRVSYEFKRNKIHGWCYHWNEAGTIILKGVVNDSGVHDLSGMYKKINELRLIPHGGIAKSFCLFTNTHFTHAQLNSLFYKAPRYITTVKHALADGANIEKFI